ncbi:DNA (cytosine-5-)-methyltransferase [Enterococcus phoeniculicola]|uniref:Cytosine-specific methyltransferase n=1 Tax=Enterococcus phoeniculicola ATCC BAA-412 TaxID=1158610 RepID=R3WME7_9ENTE|nr:DNA (cytosine-5-)-methyltransferase [Enterococcus phoeniculicola]EOL42995.1 DNA (cytosine-5-)-methyltransferase [Enterococcus phoeniculicola ATCC BAA-412]EOT76647.1 hypothetical protein I589_01604 [Enterococcus phoeniculicola ATCC BAA-412]OJG72215.1 DNA (cytosine-5-)-methyltransferase [Enterococcus phoeniculicola]
MSKHQKTFIDLFSGIGGFRFGMTWAGFKCVAYCEIDKFARRSYQSIFNTKNEVEMHDITKISDEFIQSIGYVDVIVAGFPCQPFSIAGKRKGFSDTRGTLFFEITRFVSLLKPEFIFLENVRGLLSHDEGNTFEKILSTLAELGYDCEWCCINSKNYVAQNRERVYIIGHRRTSSSSNVFPIEQTKRGDSIQFEKIVEAGQFNSDKAPLNTIFPMNTPTRFKSRCNAKRVKRNDEPMYTLKTVDRHGIIIAAKMNMVFEQANRIYSIEGLAPTLTASSGGGHTPKILIKDIGNNVCTTHDFEVRNLTPLECWRLQGFPDSAFLAAKFGSKEIANKIIEERLDHYNCDFDQKMSNHQLYKQAGNSVTVNVIYEIARSLKNISK